MTAPHFPILARPRRLPAWAGWFVVAGLVAVEFLLFRRFLLREVVWAYPPNTDQVAYLEQAYETYEQVRLHGFASAAAEQFAAPQGAMMPLQAAILFKLCGGASRFAALSLNFLYFALFQATLVWVLRWLSGRWAVAFLGLGLLQAAASPFNAAGGIYDFRMDFIAFCLFGMLIGLVVRSGAFASVRWSLPVGLCAAMLVALRFITIAYLSAVFLIVLGIETIGMLRASSGSSARRRVIGLLTAAALMAVTTGPLLWSRRQAIHDYYVVNHVAGPEKDVRAAETGTTGLWAAATYYPVTLVREHAGGPFLILAAGLLVGAAAAGALGRRSDADARQPTGPTSGASAAPSTDSATFLFSRALVFALACLLVPMAILTLDVSKSPVVANVLLAPLIWVILLACAARTGAPSRRTFLGSPGFEMALPISAVLVIVLGIGVQTRAYSTNRWMSRHRADAREVNALFEAIAARSEQAGWDDVMIFNGAMGDPLDGQIASVVSYERHGRVLHVGNEFATVLRVPEPEVFARLADCRFAIVSRRIGRVSEFEYPLDMELDSLFDRIDAACRRDMIEIGRYHPFGRDVRLFVRAPH